jgi:hypothetical protein
MNRQLDRNMAMLAKAVTEVESKTNTVDIGFDQTSTYNLVGITYDEDDAHFLFTEKTKDKIELHKRTFVELVHDYGKVKKSLGRTYRKYNDHPLRALQSRYKYQGLVDADDASKHFIAEIDMNKRGWTAYANGSILHTSNRRELSGPFSLDSTLPLTGEITGISYFLDENNNLKNPPGIQIRFNGELRSLSDFGPQHIPFLEATIPYIIPRRVLYLDNRSQIHFKRTFFAYNPKENKNKIHLSELLPKEKDEVKNEKEEKDEIKSEKEEDEETSKEEDGESEEMTKEEVSKKEEDDGIHPADLIRDNYEKLIKFNEDILKEK